MLSIPQCAIPDSYSSTHTCSVPQAPPVPVCLSCTLLPTPGPYFLCIPERSAAIYGYGWQFQASVAAQLLLAAELAAPNATEAAVWRDVAAMQVRCGVPNSWLL